MQNNTFTEQSAKRLALARRAASRLDDVLGRYIPNVRIEVADLIGGASAGMG